MLRENEWCGWSVRSEWTFFGLDVVPFAAFSQGMLSVLVSSFAIHRVCLQVGLPQLLNLDVILGMGTYVFLAKISTLMKLRLASCICHWDLKPSQSALERLT